MDDSILNGTDLSERFAQSLKEGTVVVSCGSKGSGKSTFMLAILRASVEAKAFEDYFLIFPSLYVEQHDAYKWCMERKEFNIHTGYHTHFLEKLYERNKDPKKRKSTLCIIDDATTFCKELRLSTNEALTALVSQARHLKITLWVIVHSLANILSPCLRQNVNYIIIYSISNSKLLEMIHEEYLSVFVDKKEFLKWYRGMNKKKHSSFMLATLPPIEIDTDSNNWLTTKTFRTKNSHK